VLKTSLPIAEKYAALQPEIETLKIKRNEIKEELNVVKEDLEIKDHEID